MTSQVAASASTGAPAGTAASEAAQPVAGGRPGAKPSGTAGEAAEPWDHIVSEALPAFGRGQGPELASETPLAAWAASSAAAAQPADGVSRPPYRPLPRPPPRRPSSRRPPPRLPPSRRRPAPRQLAARRPRPPRRRPRLPPLRSPQAAPRPALWLGRRSRQRCRPPSHSIRLRPGLRRRASRKPARQLHPLLPRLRRWPAPTSLPLVRSHRSGRPERRPRTRTAGQPPRLSLHRPPCAAIRFGAGPPQATPGLAPRRRSSPGLRRRDRPRRPGLPPPRRLPRRPPRPLRPLRPPGRRSRLRGVHRPDRPPSSTRPPLRRVGCRPT